MPTNDAKPSTSENNTEQQGQNKSLNNQSPAQFMLKHCRVNEIKAEARPYSKEQLFKPKPVTHKDTPPNKPQGMTQKRMG